MKANRYFFSKHTIGVLFCIGLAALTWLVGNLSKPATQLYTVEVNYPKAALGELMDAQTTSTVKVELEAIGFTLLRYAFYTPTLSLNVSELRKLGRGRYVLSKAMINQLNKAYFPDAKLLSIHPDTLSIHYHKMQRKKVPVRLQFLFPLQEDYRIDSYQIFPDSVWVSSQERQIDTLTAVYLKIKKNNKISHSLSGDIPLKSTSRIHYGTDKINYSLQIIRVTEQLMQVPIQLQHQPLSAEVKLLPDRTNILLSGNMQTIRELKPSDIVIVADYNQRKDRTIPLKVSKKPHDIEVNLQEHTQVEYLIIHP